MQLFLASLPFVIILLLSVAMRWPLWRAGLVSYAASLVIWLATFGFSLSDLVLPLVRGLLVAMDIGLILFGAIGFLEFLKHGGRLDEILRNITAYASDLRVRALLLAWLFVAFVEGAAGFGTPAAIVAPLLATMGFSPVMAAVLPLVGDSAAVPFGAVGTPVRIGLEGLAPPGAAPTAAGINVIAGIVAPLAIVTLISRDLKVPVRDVLWLATAAAFLFTVPALLVSFVGPEFPALVGALIGMALMLLILRRRKASKEASFVNLVRAFFPYLLLTALLLAGKFIFGRYRVAFDVLDERVFYAIFQPGMAFVTAAIICKLLPGPMRQGNLLGAAKIALLRLPRAWLAIFFIASLAQNVMLLLRERTVFEALFTRGLTADVLILLAPFVGGVGAFVAGSATVSCLLFGGILTQAAAATGADLTVVLALLLVGAGAGNMVALQNIVAVQASIGLEGREREMLAKLWGPCMTYLTLAALVGWLVSRAT